MDSRAELRSMNPAGVISRIPRTPSPGALCRKGTGMRISRGGALRGASASALVLILGGGCQRKAATPNEELPEAGTAFDQIPAPPFSLGDRVRKYIAKD